MTDTRTGDGARDDGRGAVGEGDSHRPSSGDSRVGDGDGLADPTETRANCGVGGVVDLESDPSHETVRDALTLLAEMDHRGARGAEPNTGDGAGVMIERPDALFEAVVDHDLPEPYAAGSFFFPPSDVESAKQTVERALAAHDCTVVGWRAVPTDAAGAELGATARAAEPAVWQAFVTPAGDADPERFDRDLYVGRRAVESAFEAADDSDTSEDPYVVSLDRERVVYKGLLTAPQLRDYYPDLRDERLQSRVALVHARFSTNTLGAWHLAHPYRNVVHNGEFNTVDGNISWMQAREADLADGGFTDEELSTVTPVVSDPDQSDTATVDEVLDLLLHGGRELPHALRMLVPEAYRGDPEMSDSRRDFYDFHASLVEPWDGPALVIGFDGDRVTGVLDRNGLRPCRYDVTTDGRLVVASEAGALSTPPEEIAERGRLRPGEVFVADPDEGRVVPDEEVFADLTDERYGEWVDAESWSLEEVTAAAEDATVADEETTVAAEETTVAAEETTVADEETTVADEETTVAGETTVGEKQSGSQLYPDNLRQQQAAAGYSHDQLNTMLEPMARQGKDPVGSMVTTRRRPSCRTPGGRCSTTSSRGSRRCRTRRSTTSGRIW